MPAFSVDVPMVDGSTYRVTRLLSKGNSNTKTAKSDKAGLGYATYGLNLAPALASGYNLCTSASKHCIKSCLFTSGLAHVFPRTIQPARIARARFYANKQTRPAFQARLLRELASAEKSAARKGVRLAVRLNVISDVMWERVMPMVFTDFPGVQFYDYTKHFNRMDSYLAGRLPTNYHLTFSWSGTNENECRYVLEHGGNVAVPFRVSYRGNNRKPLPATFLGSTVFDGDVTDLRFLDPTPTVVGLRAKGRAKHNASTFVINPSDRRVA